MTEARYALSSVCAEAGDPDGAIEFLRGVVRAAPQFGEAHYNLGLNLWKSYRDSAGVRNKLDLDEAARELTAAGQLEPTQSRAPFALGQVLAERGDLAAP